MKAKINEDYSIREATLEDAKTIWQAIDLHRDYLKTWLPFVPKLHTVEDEAAFLHATLSVPYQDRNIVFIIEKGKEFCGLIGFVNTDNVNHRTEIGYWLLPEYQGQGIMTQSVKYLSRWAIRERNMHRVQICCAVGNHPSNAIPQRLGFKMEGTIRHGELLSSGEYADINIYGILEREI